MVLDCFCCLVGESVLFLFLLVLILFVWSIDVERGRVGVVLPRERVVARCHRKFLVFVLFIFCHGIVCGALWVRYRDVQKRLASHGGKWAVVRIICGVCVFECGIFVSGGRCVIELDFECVLDWNSMSFVLFVVALYCVM